MPFGDKEDAFASFYINTHNSDWTNAASDLRNQHVQKGQIQSETHIVLLLGHDA